MAPADHNKTLCLLHGMVGVLALTALLILAAVELNKPAPRDFFNSPPAARPVEEGHSGALDGVPKQLYFLPLPLLQLLTASGLFKRRRWGRTLALILSALYVFVFPLGTLLATYTWWFFHSAGSKQLYTKDEGAA